MAWRLLALTLLLIGCSTKTILGHRFHVSSSSVVPGELVELTDDQGAFDADSYDATLGGQPLTLGRVDATHLILLTPAAQPAGNAVLTAQVPGLIYEDLPLAVGAAPVIADPVAYVMNDSASDRTEIADLRTTYANDASMLAFLDAENANLDHEDAVFQAADPATQAAVAAMLAANVLPSIGLVSRLSVQPSELAAIYKSGSQLALYGSAIGLAIIYFGAAPEAAAVVGIVAAYLYFREARTFRALQDKLLTDHDIFEVARYLWGEKRPQASALVLQSGQATSLHLSGTYRTVVTGDSTSASAPVAAAAGAVLEVESFWDAANARLFQSLGPLPPDEQPDELGQAIDGRLLTLDATSLPSGVTLVSAKSTSDGIAVTLTATTEQTFMMEVAYDDGLTTATLEVPVDLQVPSADAGVPDAPIDAAPGTPDASPADAAQPDAAICEPSCGGATTCCDTRCVDLQTSSLNCGACGRSCYGTTCSAGVCAPSTVLSGLAVPTALFVDADNIYFTEQATTMNGYLGNGQVIRASKTTLALHPIATGQSPPLAIVVANSTKIFWNTGDSQGEQSVYSYRKSNLSACIGPVSAQFSCGLQGDRPWPGLAIDPTDTIAYIQHGGGWIDTDPEVAIFTAPFDGSAMALDATRLFFVDQYNGVTLSYVPLGSNGDVPSVTIATDLAGSFTGRPALATDGVGVFWVTPTAIMRIGRDGGTPTAVATGTAFDSITGDSDGVCFSDRSAGTVSCYRTAQHATSVIARGQATPLGVATDPTSVYWANSGDGTIRRVSK